MSTIYDQYETVIGLEIHIQLNTNSKAFCGDDAHFGGAPNTHVSAISLGHPGTLPRLNAQQIKSAIKLGLALGSEINSVNTFDRKNYFYADLPKGYQITQDNQPFCRGGSVMVKTINGERAIRTHHIHMEEDAGKSIHDLDPNHSFIDLNRAGVPLLEIVTEPDLRSGEEVEAYMLAMRQLVRYLDISDGNMDEGSMRCDVNISVRKKGETTFGERCEVKNVNSMRFAKRAIQYEVKRQIDLIESGGKVRQQTLNFDPETGVTSPLRDKEDAHDYRYFPEPDLPPVHLSNEQIELWKSELPALPKELYAKFTKEHQLSDYDATILTEERPVAVFYQKLAELNGNYKAVANLMINKIRPYIQEQKIHIQEFPVPVNSLSDFIQLIVDGKVASAMAYQRIFPKLIETPNETPLSIAEQLHLIQSADEDFLMTLVKEVIEKNPQKVAAYQKGKKGLIGFFMGEIMRASKGKADPKATNQLLGELLRK